MAPDEPSGTRPVGPVVLRIKLRYDTVEAMVRSLRPTSASPEAVLADEVAAAGGSGDQVRAPARERDARARRPRPGQGREAAGSKESQGDVRDGDRAHARHARESRGHPAHAGSPSRARAGRDRNPTSRRHRCSAARGFRRDPDQGHRKRSGSSAAASSSRCHPARPVRWAVDLAPPAVGADGRRQGHERGRAGTGASAPPATAARRDHRVRVGAGSAGPLPGLDEDVDVAAVLARARLLAGGDLDGELEALRESDAAPLGIDIEAASAALARQLGGAPVRRDRSTHWATPPAIAIVPAEVVSIPAPAAEVQPASAWKPSSATSTLPHSRST